MAMPKGPRFPPEIVDMIIDGLSESPASLTDTCVVSQACVPRCRKHLFKELTIRNGRKDKGFPEFAEFLRKSPYVGHYIEILTLSGDPEWVPERKYRDPVDVVCILSHLPCLDYLELHDMTLHSDPLPPQCVFPKLNMLHLHNIISQDDANKAAYTLIRLFPEVDELRLEEISPGKRCSTATAEVGPITLNTNCQVRRLSLELVAPGLHHQLMYDPSVAGSVREVEVDIEDMDRAHALTALLVSARDRIESLSVDLTPFFLREGYDFGLPDARHMLGVLAPGIKACTAIQKLVLAIGFCRPARDAYNRTVWNFLIGLLSELSATIEHITIKFAMSQDESYEMENPWRPSVKSLRLDWNALRDRLGQLRKLQTLDIMELEGARWYFTSEDEAFIGKKLEGLSCGLTLVRYEKHAM